MREGDCYTHDQDEYDYDCGNDNDAFAALFSSVYVTVHVCLLQNLAWSPALVQWYEALREFVPELQDGTGTMIMCCSGVFDLDPPERKMEAGSQQELFNRTSLFGLFDTVMAGTSRLPEQLLL